MQIKELKKWTGVEQALLERSPMESPI